MASLRLISMIVMIQFTYMANCSANGDTEQENAWVREVSKLTNYALDSVIQTGNIEDTDILSVDWNNADNISAFIVSQEVTSYMMGYYVCIAVGLVLALVVTIGGLITCCCRCCCRDGRKMQQEGKKDGCKRGCCGVFLFVFVVIVLLGCVCMFQMTFALRDSLTAPESNVFVKIAGSLNNIEQYTTSTLNELENSAQGTFSDTSTQVLSTLEEVPEGAFEVIDSKTNITDILDEFDAEVNELKNAVTLINDTLNAMDTLDVKKNELSSELGNLKQNISDTLSSCIDVLCNNTMVMADEMDVQINYNYNPDIRNSLPDILNNLDSIDSLTSVVNVDISNIANEVNIKMEPHTAEVKTQLDSIKKSIESLLQDADDELGDLGLNETAIDIETLSTDEDSVLNSYVWDSTFIPLLVFSGIISAIVGFYMLGLLFGCCCPRPKSHEGSCCKRSCGSHCLLTGLALFFIFYWIVALVSILMLVTGGLAHTAICRAFIQPNESKFVDDILDQLAVNGEINLPLDISVSDIYTDCGQNVSLYQALDLGSRPEFNLSTIFDLAEIKQKLDEIKDKLDVDIGVISLDKDALKVSVDAVTSSLSIVGQEITTNIKPELEKDVVEGNLNELAKNLRDIATNSPGVDVDKVNELANNADTLNVAYVEPMTTENQDLSAKLENASATIQSINMDQLYDRLTVAQETINTDGNNMIKTYIDDTADELSSEINTSVDDLKNDVENEVGRCYPVYASYNTMMHAGCVTFLYAFNNLWFCMAWSLVFLLPAIFMAFSLADLYRKTAPYARSRNSTNHYYDAYGQNGSGPQPPQDRPVKGVSNSELPPRGSQPPPYNEDHPGREVYYVERPVRNGTRPEPRGVPVYPEEPPHYERRHPSQARYM